MGIRIKGWGKFQHFKDRKPPWVKLYRDLLDDMEWHELSPVAAKALVSFWLIASEDDGNLPSIKKLAFRLRISESSMKSIVSELSHWLEQDDISLISDRYQHDPLETERETEKEEETEAKKETDSARKRAPTLAKPEDVQEGVWDEWKQLRKAKRATVTTTVLEGAREEADKAGLTLEQFLKVWIRRGSQGLEASWLKPDERGGSRPINKQEALEARNRQVAADWVRDKQREMGMGA